MNSKTILSDQALQDILSDILKILDFKNDKNTFINNFTRLCLQETLLNYLDSLPLEKQKKFKKELKDKDVTEAVVVIKNFIEPELYMRIYLDSNVKMLKEYLASIYPVLTIDQKDKLKEYFTFLKSRHHLSI